MNLLDGVKNLANNAYFYSMSGPESNFSFRDIGVGGNTRAISSVYVSGAQMVTLGERPKESAPFQHFAHILVGTSFDSLSEFDQHAIIIHEFLHMLLNTDGQRDHRFILRMLGVDAASFAALLLLDGDPLSTFIRRDCEVP
jgi:hypothetical protein